MYCTFPVFCYILSFILVVIFLFVILLFISRISTIISVLILIPSVFLSWISFAFWWRGWGGRIIAQFTGYNLINRWQLILNLLCINASFICTFVNGVSFNIDVLEGRKLYISLHDNDCLRCLQARRCLFFQRWLLLLLLIMLLFIFFWRFRNIFINIRHFTMSWRYDFWKTLYGYYSASGDVFANEFDRSNCFHS